MTIDSPVSFQPLPELIPTEAEARIEPLAAKVKLPKLAKPPKIKVPKVKVPKTTVKATALPKVRAAAPKKATTIKLQTTSSANSLKTMVQREAIHVVGSVIQRGVSNQIVQTEKDRDAAKKTAAAQQAAQAAAKPASTTPPAPNPASSTP